MKYIDRQITHLKMMKEFQRGNSSELTYHLRDYYTKYYRRFNLPTDYF